jgi:WD40 repeat protein
MEGHLGRVHALAFTPDGERLATCSEDRRVRLWSVASGLELETVEHAGRPMDFGHRLSLAVSSDGEALVWAHGTDIVISSLTSGESLHELQYHDNTVTSLAIAGRRLASGSLDTKVIVTDLRTGEVERVIEGRGGEIDAVALSPDGSQVFACYSMPGVVRGWNVASGRIQFRLEADDQAVRALAVADTDPILYTGSEDGVIRAWSIARRARKRLVRTYRGHERAVRGLVFDGKSSRLLSASDDGTLRHWDPVSGESEVLFASDAPLTALAVSRAGDHVACGDAIGRVRIFDAELHALPGLRMDTVSNSTYRSRSSRSRRSRAEFRESASSPDSLADQGRVPGRSRSLE